MYSYLTQGSNSQSCPWSHCSQGQILWPFLPMVAGQPDPSWPCSTVTMSTMGHTSGYSSPLSVDKLTDKYVLKGNDVLSLQDRAQSSSRLQVNSGSISEIFSTDISPIFTETCLGLCSWILANQQSTQRRDSFLCFLCTVWLLSYLALAGDSQHMLYTATQSDLWIYLDLNTKNKKFRPEAKIFLIINQGLLIFFLSEY